MEVFWRFGMGYTIYMFDASLSCLSWYILCFVSALLDDFQFIREQPFHIVCMDSVDVCVSISKQTQTFGDELTTSSS